MTRRHRLLTPLSFALLLLWPGKSGWAQEALREWKNASGQIIRATLVDIDSKQKAVTLLREDGADFKIPIGSLSEPDQAYIEQRAEKYTWLEIAALDAADPQLRAVLNAVKIADELKVTVVERERPSHFNITRVNPIGYRERHLCSYEGEVPHQMAIDHQGNLVFLTWETNPTAIQRVSSNGVLTTLYESPATEHCRMNTPVISDQAQIAAIPGGGFFVRSRWKEVTRLNGNVGFKSRLDYFTMQLGSAKGAANPVFTPHFSEISFPLRTRIQTQQAFGGEDLIILLGRVILHDMPKRSSSVSEGSAPLDYATSWIMDARPLQVISKSQILMSAIGGDHRVVLLVDLDAKTFAPVGSVANTAEGRDAQLDLVAVSPDGRHLVHYNQARKAFMRLELGQPGK